MESQQTNSGSPVAIVTGISRGYGLAVTRSLLSEGWKVVGDGRDPAKLAKAADGLQAGDSLNCIAGDITDDKHLRELVQAASKLGALQLVVNNAGALGPSPLPELADIDADDMKTLFRVNAIAPLRLIQIALPLLKANSGAIINMTSDAAIEAYPGWGGYAASKAALEQITAVLAAETPELRIYSLDPGDMQTEMHQAAFPGEDISDRPQPEVSAPAVAKLVASDAASGRYRAADVLG